MLHLNGDASLADRKDSSNGDPPREVRLLQLVAVGVGVVVTATARVSR